MGGLRTALHQLRQLERPTTDTKSLGDAGSYPGRPVSGAESLMQRTARKTGGELSEDDRYASP